MRAGGKVQGVTKYEVDLLKSIVLQQKKIKKVLKEIYVHQKFVVRHELLTTKQFERVYAVCKRSDKACRDLLELTGKLVDVSQKRLKQVLPCSGAEDDPEIRKLLDETSNMLINLPKEVLIENLNLLSKYASDETYKKVRGIIEGIDWIKVTALDNVPMSGLLTKIFDTMTYFDSQAALNQFISSPFQRASLEAMLETANNKIMMVMSTNGFVFDMYKSTC